MGNLADERETRHSQWQLNYRSRLINRIGTYLEFIRILEENDIYDARLFRSFRQGTSTQGVWGELTGVAQGTIGNWERGITYPNRAYRKKLLEASHQMLDFERRRVDALSERLGFKTSIDPVSTQDSLDSSILRASLTDFDYDETSGKIVAIPFSQDERFASDSELNEDKLNLLQSLAAQTELIVSGLERGANAETDRLCEYFEKYRYFAVQEPTNPRLLHRLGETLAKRTASDDVRGAISDWDDQAIDGFNADHIELMRLYYREALAKAQLVEAADVDGELSGDEHQAFYKVADLIESAANENGIKVYDEDIPTLLRDIGREIRDIGEAETFSYDDKRKSALT